MRSAGAEARDLAVIVTREDVVVAAAEGEAEIDRGLRRADVEAADVHEVAVGRDRPEEGRMAGTREQVHHAHAGEGAALLPDQRVERRCRAGGVRRNKANVAHLAEHQDAGGPFNLSCPQTPTNAEFTRELGRALGRPTVLPAPAFAIRLGASRMAPELLGSKNAVPQALVDAGYEFRDPDVTAVLAAGLGQSS